MKNNLFFTIILGMILGILIGFTATYSVMNERELYNKLVNLEKIEYRYEAEVEACESRAANYFHSSTGCNFEKARLEERFGLND